MLNFLKENETKYKFEFFKDAQYFDGDTEYYEITDEDVAMIVRGGTYTINSPTNFEEMKHYYGE